MLKEIFSVESLKAIFNDKLKNKNVVGIDGLSSRRFQDDLDIHTKLISKKVLSGRYSFINYAEILVLKGREKYPRILSVPSLRDQLVLKALNSYLTSLFPFVFTDTAKSQVTKLTNFLTENSGKSNEYGILKLDVSGFYDNINRAVLMEKIRKSVSDPIACKLIYDSLANTTVPRNSSSKSTKDYFRAKGVPQGIATSNILANIYLCELDKILERESGISFRYVDDILVIAKHDRIAEIENVIEKKFEKLGLKFNSEKTKKGGLNCTPFEFLGYNFTIDSKIENKAPCVKIGVRDSSVEKLIRSIAGLFSSAKNGNKSFKSAKKNMNTGDYRSLFIQKLNEKISGAIAPPDKKTGKPSKNYGWLFYFDKINDLSLLFTLDRLVLKFCKRSKLLKNKRPAELKSFVKAYREIALMRKENRTTSDYIITYPSRSPEVEDDGHLIDEEEMAVVKSILEDLEFESVDLEAWYLKPWNLLKNEINKRF